MDDSLSAAKEFINKYPMYEQMMNSVIETIQKANKEGWFNYDSTFNEVDSIQEDITYYVLSLNNNIILKKNKKSISFKYNSTFARIETRKKKKTVNIYLKLDPTRINSESGFTKDIRKLKHRNINLEIVIRCLKDIDKAKKLINEAYQEDLI